MMTKPGWNAMPETHEPAERRSFAAEQARIGCTCAEHLSVLRVTYHYRRCRAHRQKVCIGLYTEAADA
ncbi:MAG TPA: hypothetical protein VGM65_06105 [Candidatus Udaeobacter sp.]